MKLTKTKGAKNANKIELLEGIYMKSMPMSKMQSFFVGLADVKDGEQETMINDLFAKILVDPKGEPFEDLIDSKATDVLPLNLIMDIMNKITETLNPSEGK